MYLHFEKNTNTKSDCSISSLSWMNKVPEDEGGSLNRTNYFEDGWLATGNLRGIVGVTLTTSQYKRNVEYAIRTNYNLRGHRSNVTLVKWNEPFQKLASCDSSGVINVWIKYEGRWSIELVYDRNTLVTHFSWSHNGRMVLIGYQDGYVLVGSVEGERNWSTMLNIEGRTTCGIWTPDDQQVYLGTSQGQIIAMDVNGAMVSQVQLCSDVGILSMSWSCDKYNMEAEKKTEHGVTNASKRPYVLAVSFQNGFIYLLKSFEDISPVHICTGINGILGIVMEWSNSRKILAVARCSYSSTQLSNDQDNIAYENLLMFYTETGALLYTARIPNNSTPVSALTWDHNDKRIFMATGNQIHIAWVSFQMASLQLLCSLQIQANIRSKSLLSNLSLPFNIVSMIENIAQTIRCCVPDIKSLREFVIRPPTGSTRLYCTIIRHDNDSNLSSGSIYILYVEYLGGLVPLLKGKRTSKIRPEFVIFDPQYKSEDCLDIFDSKIDYNSSRGLQRQQLKENTQRETTDELVYVDTLPEEVKLVEITSNIWRTKFNIHGLAEPVPSNLGQVTYKLSLFHMQPRQMRLVITDLRVNSITDPNPYIISGDQKEKISPPALSALKSRDNKYQYQKAESKSDQKLDKLNAAKVFVMSNTTPMWNENSREYQLSFGGRVTQESSKNFQVDHDGKQVIQCGCIDRNMFTLDFEYPFSPVQAFSIALINVAQYFK